MTTSLTKSAQAQHTALTSLLATLGLTADQAHALLLAPAFAEEQNDRATTLDAAAHEDQLAEWKADGQAAWSDVLCEIPTFLTTEA